jgi:hypothetical protein
VFLIAMKTGWHEQDILNLPVARFQFYIEILTGKDK